MDGLDGLAQALGITDKKDADWHVLAKVSAVNPDGSLTVYMAGSLNPTTVDAYCDAQAGDVVCVLISKGKARAIARKGGSIPSKDVDWTQSTYAGGYYMRRGKMVTVKCESYGSITAPNNSYATVFTLPQGFRLSAPGGELFGACSTLGGSYPVSYRIKDDGTVSVGGCGTSPNYWAFNATFPCE